MMGSRRKPSQNDLDLYKLSSAVEAGASKSSQPEQIDQVVTSPKKSKSRSWYTPTFGRMKNESPAKEKMPTQTSAAADNESEKSLRAESPSGSSGEDRGMQIMVSKSFFVSNSQRASTIEKDHR